MLRDFLDPGRIVTIRKDTKTEALGHLVDVLVDSVPALDREEVLAAVYEREEAGSTRLSETLAMPHARVPAMPGKCYITLGRCPDGVDYEDTSEAQIQLMALVVVDEEESQLFLQVLADVAKWLNDKDVQRQILAAGSADEVLATLQDEETVVIQDAPPGINPFSLLMVHSLERLTRQAEARAVLVYSDALESMKLLSMLPKNRRLILAGKHAKVPEDLTHPDVHAVQVPFGGDFRTRQIRLALLFCLGRGLLDPADTVVCLTGLPAQGIADTVVVTSVNRECQIFAAEEFGQRDLATDVQPEVLERVIQLACEIGSEGREGRSVGTLFVLGDHERVLGMSKQLVMNPFMGYDEAVRNILDPTLGETVKEFAGIDGAFVIRGDGVLLSAGAYLLPVNAKTELPSGFGSRHQAAARISAVTKAYGIAISQSTGTVSVYKDGNTLTTIERTRG